MKRKIICKRCGHIWYYQGKKRLKKYPVYITCSECKTSIRLNGKSGKMLQKNKSKREEKSYE